MIVKTNVFRCSTFSCFGITEFYSNIPHGSSKNLSWSYHGKASLLQTTGALKLSPLKIRSQKEQGLINLGEKLQSLIFGRFKLNKNQDRLNRILILTFSNYLVFVKNRSRSLRQSLSISVNYTVK